jgi:hypothetical protein
VKTYGNNLLLRSLSKATLVGLLLAAACGPEHRPPEMPAGKGAAASPDAICRTCGDPPCPPPDPPPPPPPPPSCDVGSYLCSGVCIPNTQCCTTAQCPAAPANAIESCTSHLCGFACNAGFKVCNGACIPNSACCTAADCPTPLGGTASCLNNVCSGSCTDPSFHLCSDNSCSQCCNDSQCPYTANGADSCLSGTCQPSCAPGYQMCNGKCIPDSLCCTSTSCAPPPSGNGTTQCSNYSCVVTCNPGYHQCGNDCVAACCQIAD